MDVASELAEFLGRVETGLKTCLDDEPTASGDRGDTLMEAARHLCVGSGGKRVRPMMVRLFGGILNVPVEPLVDIAIASELIHSASLLHDDVVDAGMFRRGRPTVNARWGNIVAVMSGDLLLTTALGKLGRIDTQLMPSAVDLVAEMTRAAIAEVEARGDLALPLERLRYIAEGKTGSLFAWCGAAAALLAKTPEAAPRFAHFGRRLGIAFQIADDIRDITGTDVGKPQYADIQSRSPSMPVLLAVSKDEALRRKLKDAWAFATVTPERQKELGNAVLASGAVEQSLAKMQEEIAIAVDALGPYASHPCGAELLTWAHRLNAGMQEQVKATA